MSVAAGFRLRTGMAILLAAGAAGLPSAAVAARWITPAWSAARRPACAPVALYWFTVEHCPVVYRTELDVPRSAAAASALVRSSGYLYVQVDGRQVFGWAPDVQPPVGPPQPVSAQRVHAIDLTRALTPGRHVLTVSAPTGGFVLDGTIRDPAGATVARLQSDDRWTVAQLPATTVLEDHPIAQIGYRAASAVRPGTRWVGAPAALRAAARRFDAERAQQDARDVAWRVELLEETGRYVVDNTAYGWGGPLRLSAAVRAAGRRVAQAPAPRSAAAAARTADAIERASRQAFAEDEARALGLLATVVPGPWPRRIAAERRDLAALRAQMERRLGHAANRLNESRYDRFGWIDMPRLVDSSVQSWGIRITPPIDVLTTPLSPAAVWMPETAAVELRHAGTLAIGTRPGDRWRWTGAYDAGRDGRLPANWVLLDWHDADRPAGTGALLLVFEKNPLQIVCESGRTRIRLGGPGERIIAVRPWGDREPPPLETAAAVDALTLWSRAARAVPVNYLSVTRVLEPARSAESLSVHALTPGPLLEQTLVYDYLRTSDEWGTSPLETAPLPSLASYALDHRPDAFALSARVEILQPIGALGPYRGVRGTDRLSYRYRVEPYPRLAGFTSWMFSWIDAGVPGNAREVELLAAIGANSFRPQHNNSSQPPPAGLFPPSEQRSMLEILADDCRAAGVNYMHNVDQRLDKLPAFVREHYDEFLAHLDAHYEEVVRRIGDRPFWSVAYDLVNEPHDHDCRQYGAAMRALTERIRERDPVHLVAVEPCGSEAAVDAFAHVELTGDPLTLYSFHDYGFRLTNPDERWPTTARNISSIFERWLPAVRFQIEHGVPLHCGELGDFDPATNDSAAQPLLLNDLLRVLDQFGMHHHYYSGRSLYDRLPDGSLRPSNVVRAYRAYFARSDFNAYYRWPSPAGDYAGR